MGTSESDPSVCGIRIAVRSPAEFLFFHHSGKVLRGLESEFQLTPRSKESRLRKELEDIFTSKYAASRRYFSGGATDDIGDEDYFPYVSLSLVPFAMFVQK